MTKTLYALTLCLVTLAAPINTYAQITGFSTICTGNSSVLRDTAAGGTWSSGDTDVVYIYPSGYCTGVSAGTAIISYTALAGIATTMITVNPSPSPIVGGGTTCGQQQ